MMHRTVLALATVFSVCLCPSRLSTLRLEHPRLARSQITVPGPAEAAGLRC